MKIDLSALAYSVRKNFTTEGITIPLGHAQQLVAASVGYKSLAAYQAAAEVAALGDPAAVVLDVDLVSDRVHELQVPAKADAAIELIRQTFEELMPRAAILTSEVAYMDSVQEYVDSKVLNDDVVLSQTAMTNGWPKEVHMPVEWDIYPTLPDDDPIQMHISGQVTMEQDWDRTYWGHEVDVEGDLLIERLGKRCFGPVQFRVTRAKLLWMGADDEPTPPPRDVAPLLAELLGVDESDAAVLDYEVIYDESEDGLLYALILDFSRTVSPELAEKIRSKHPTLTVRVAPDFFEGVAVER